MKPVAMDDAGAQCDARTTPSGMIEFTLVALTQLGFPMAVYRAGRQAYEQV